MFPRIVDQKGRLQGRTMQSLRILFRGGQGVPSVEGLMFPWWVVFVKRLIDITISLFGVLVLLVLFPFVAIAIKLDSRGPIFYRQTRVSGLKESSDEEGCLAFETFEIIKFRTMTVDAEKESGPMQAREGDARITRVGAFLRAYKLDEWPQFWNVLMGSMSVVGPRPERPELLARIAEEVPFFEERCRGMKPGITGLAQISLSYSGNLIKHGVLNDVLQDVIEQDAPAEPEEERLAGISSERLELSNKLLLDMAYSLAHEKFWLFLRMEFFILFSTPRAMLFRQRR